MVLGGEISSRWLGHDGGILIRGISAPFKRGPREIPHPPHTHTCEDTARRWSSTNQKAAPHHTPNLPVPWSWTSQAPELWEVNLLFINQAVYSILLKQPEQTKPWVIKQRHSNIKILRNLLLDFPWWQHNDRSVLFTVPQLDKVPQENQLSTLLWTDFLKLYLLYITGCSQLRTWHIHLYWGFKCCQVNLDITSPHHIWICIQEFLWGKGPS